MSAMALPSDNKWPFPFLPPPPTPTGAQRDRNALGQSAAVSDLFPLLGPTNPLATPGPHPGGAVSGVLGLGPPPALPPASAPPESGMGALSLLGRPPPPAPTGQHVEARFTKFLANLTITPLQLEDGRTKHAGVRACLNRHYWGTRSETANSLLI